MSEIRLEDVGECEDVRPCTNCGDEYIFLIDDDPGHCPGCLRLARGVTNAVRAERREAKKL